MQTEQDMNYNVPLCHHCWVIYCIRQHFQLCICEFAGCISSNKGIVLTRSLVLFFIKSHHHHTNMFPMVLSHSYLICSESSLATIFWINPGFGRDCHQYNPERTIETICLQFSMLISFVSLDKSLSNMTLSHLHSCTFEFS